jgi:hypothetical protein
MILSTSRSLDEANRKRRATGAADAQRAHDAAQPAQSANTAAASAAAAAMYVTLANTVFKFSHQAQH